MGNQKDLYEDNQRDLEKAVEDLSELLEQPIEPETIPELRQKVTDKTVRRPFLCLAPLRLTTRRVGVRTET